MSAIVTTAPLESAARRERRDDVADVGVLGQHDAVERRADQRLLDARPAPCARSPRAAATLRPRAGDRRRRARSARAARCRAPSREMKFFASRSCVRFSCASASRSSACACSSVAARRLTFACGAVALRGDVAALQARDDLARLHARAFGHAEPFEPAGRLRRDRRLALRDDVAGGVEHARIAATDTWSTTGVVCTVERPSAATRTSSRPRPATSTATSAAATIQRRRRRERIGARSRSILSLERSVSAIARRKKCAGNQPASSAHSTPRGAWRRRQLQGRTGLPSRRRRMRAPPRTPPATSNATPCAAKSASCSHASRRLHSDADRQHDGAQPPGLRQWRSLRPWRA